MLQDKDKDTHKDSHHKDSHKDSSHKDKEKKEKIWKLRRHKHKPSLDSNFAANQVIEGGLGESSEMPGKLSKSRSLESLRDAIVLSNGENIPPEEQASPGPSELPRSSHCVTVHHKRVSSIDFIFILDPGFSRGGP